MYRRPQESRSGRWRAAALELARLYKWDCVRTRINLGPGEYKLTVRHGSTYIDIPGIYAVFDGIGRGEGPVRIERNGTVSRQSGG